MNWCSEVEQNRKTKEAGRAESKKKTKTTSWFCVSTNQCNNSHLKFSISKTKELVVDTSCMSGCKCIEEN